MSFSSFITWPARWILEQTGHGVVDQGRYGCDVFVDIERLCRAWGDSVDVFFDVGANRGDTTILARYRFKRCRIMAFEPHPKTFAKLRRRIAQVKNVELRNVALGSEVGDKVMFEYNESVLNSLVPNAQFPMRFKIEGTRELVISCTTIDAYCRENNVGTIDILKIDTEGYDLNVLMGATSMIARGAIKFIYFEFNDIVSRTDTSGGALLPIDQFIRPHGFRFIATYNDYLVPRDEPFLVSNALYALPPKRRG